MSAKTNAALTTENASVITGQTTPESITPLTDGAFRKNIIDSMWNRTDDLLTLPPISLTKAQLLTSIGLGGLNDGQQVTITDRNDGNPLILKCQGTNKIHPYATWVKAGKPLTVIIDYTGTYEGETLPFIAVFDENRNLKTNTPIIIADGTESSDSFLTGDSNGETAWQKISLSLTRAQLVTAIGSNLLTDKQWIEINDRLDGYPLFVCCQGNNKISPFGIWIKGGKPLSVIMDYVNTYEGETLPFIAIFDENRKLNLPNQIIIADGSESADAVLACDANGKSTWKKATSYQSAQLNPAGTSGVEIMLGLAGSITPAKTGKVLIVVSGEFISNDIISLTYFNLIVGTGTPPINGGAPNLGVAYQHNDRLASSATLTIPFSFNYIATLTPGTTYWIDMSIGNNSGSAVQLYNTYISAIEQ